MKTDNNTSLESVKMRILLEQLMYFINDDGSPVDGFRFREITLGIKKELLSEQHSPDVSSVASHVSGVGNSIEQAREEAAKNLVDWIGNEGLPATKRILEELKRLNAQKSSEQGAQVSDTTGDAMENGTMATNTTPAASTEVEELAVKIYGDNRFLFARQREGFVKGYEYATTLLKAKEEEIREKTEALRNLLLWYKDATSEVVSRNYDVVEQVEATLSKYSKEG